MVNVKHSTLVSSQMDFLSKEMIVKVMDQFDEVMSDEVIRMRW